MDRQAKREFKDQLYEQFARIGRTLANPSRLELLDLLAQGERTVEDLAMQADLPVANVSQHLQHLRAARLVEVRRSGVYAYYRLVDQAVFRLWQTLVNVSASRLAEVDQLVRTFLQDREGLQEMSAAQLAERLQDGGIVVVDVRPSEEFRAGHIAGAWSIPFDQLASRLDEIPRDQDIIAYCRGPYCVFADEAVALLREHGYRAVRLAEGLPDWRLRGLPVDQGSRS